LVLLRGHNNENFKYFLKWSGITNKIIRAFVKISILFLNNWFFNLCHQKIRQCSFRIVFHRIRWFTVEFKFNTSITELNLWRSTLDSYCSQSRAVTYFPPFSLMIASKNNRNFSMSLCRSRDFIWCTTFITTWQ